MLSTTLTKLMFIEPFLQLLHNACSFLGAYGVLNKIDHMLGQKRNLNKFWNNELMYRMFYDKKGIKLEISKSKISRNPQILETTIDLYTWAKE